MEHTTGERAAQLESKRICRMHEIVEKIRSSEEIGVRYMQEWEERALEQQEARKEGRKSGFKEGRKAGFSDGRRSGLLEGAESQKKAIALEMKKEGMALEQIARMTKLTIEEVEGLRL